MKKALALLLTVALILGCLPAVCAETVGQERSTFLDEGHDCYLKPYATEDWRGVVLGQSAILRFYQHITNEEAYYIRIRVFSVQEGRDIYTERFRVDPESTVFTYQFTADWARFKTGLYFLEATVWDEYGEERLGIADVVKLNVVSSSVALESLEFFVGADVVGDGTVDLTLYTINNEKRGHLVFVPQEATGAREASFVSSNPEIVKIEQVAGYVKLIAVSEGTATITGNCSGKSVSVTVVVKNIPGLVLDDPMPYGPLCPGEKKYISARSGPNGFQVYPETVTSSDPSVGIIDEEGYFVAVGPGTTTITAEAGGYNDSVEIVVREHELVLLEDSSYAATCTEDGREFYDCLHCDTDVIIPLPATGHSFAEGTFEHVEPTATQPGRDTGDCTVCGETAVSNVLPAVFTDTPASVWYCPYVDYVYENGIMNGTAGDTFSPDRSLNRAMVATVLYRLAGSPAVESESPFTDVAEGAWYYDAVLWAAEQGIVTGYPGGTFLPMKDITREQIATMLYRYEVKYGTGAPGETEVPVLPDANEVSSYAVQAMQWTMSHGYIQGISSGGTLTLAPRNTATRAQFATIITRYLQNQTA